MQVEVEMLKAFWSFAAEFGLLFLNLSSLYAISMWHKSKLQWKETAC